MSRSNLMKAAWLHFLGRSILATMLVCSPVVDAFAESGSLSQPVAGCVDLHAMGRRIFIGNAIESIQEQLDARSSLMDVLSDANGGKDVLVLTWQSCGQILIVRLQAGRVVGITLGYQG